MQCNDDAQGMVTPDMQHDTRKMTKVEDSMLKCIEGVVDKTSTGLKPMKERIESYMI